MRLIALSALLCAFASAAAAAQPVTLRASVTDEDGRVTLGELFDGAGRAGSVTLALSRPGSGTVLDAGQVQRVAQANGLAWANETGLRRIVVRSGAATTAVGRVEVLTYTRSLNAGEIVAPEDLAWGKAPAAPLDAARDSDALVGMAAKRPLRSGAIATTRDVTAPLVIRKGDDVSVTYASGGVSLTLQAKAMDSAAAGKSVTVANPVSKKIFQALAVGPGAAIVGPDAAQMRASANTFASLR